MNMVGILKRAFTLLLAALQAFLLLGRVVPVTGGTEEKILTAAELEQECPKG